MACVLFGSTRGGLPEKWHAPVFVPLSRSASISWGEPIGVIFGVAALGAAVMPGAALRVSGFWALCAYPQSTARGSCGWRAFLFT